MKALSAHDELTTTIARVLAAYGFDVISEVKRGAHQIKGDSGVTYYPDIVALIGPASLVIHVKANRQRGTRDEIDRGAIQLLQAELDDLTAALKRPHGMIVSPHGIADDAKQLAEHLGILVILLPLDVAHQVLQLDPVNDTKQLIQIGQEHGITFGPLAT